MNKRWSSTSSVIQTWDNVVLDTKNCCQSSRHLKAEVAIVTLHLSKGSTPQHFPFSTTYLSELTRQSAYSIFDHVRQSQCFDFTSSMLEDMEPCVRTTTCKISTCISHNAAGRSQKNCWAFHSSSNNVRNTSLKCSEVCAVQWFVLIFIHLTMQKCLKINFKFTTSWLCLIALHITFNKFTLISLFTLINKQ